MRSDIRYRSALKMALLLRLLEGLFASYSVYYSKLNSGASIFQRTKNIANIRNGTKERKQHKTKQIRRRNAATIISSFCVVTESSRMVSTITIYTGSTAACPWVMTLYGRAYGICFSFLCFLFGSVLCQLCDCAIQPLDPELNANVVVQVPRFSSSKSSKTER